MYGELVCRKCEEKLNRIKSRSPHKSCPECREEKLNITVKYGNFIQGSNAIVFYTVTTCKFCGFYRKNYEVNC